MTAEHAIRELNGLIPDLTIVGSFEVGSGFDLVKGDDRSALKKQMVRFVEELLLSPQNQNINSLRVDNGSRSGFFYFLKVGIQKWMLLASDKPVFGLVRLYLQQIEIDREDATAPGQPETTMRDDAEMELKSARRMQKQFHRQIHWLSDKIAQKAIYHNSLEVVSGCTYTFKNFEDTILIAMADTHMTGVSGAIVTFSIQSLFSQYLNEGSCDIVKAVQKVSDEAHAHNLKITSEEAMKNLKPVHVGILRIDYKAQKMDFATNGLSLVYKSKNRIVETVDKADDLIETHTTSLNEAGPTFLMNRQMRSAIATKEMETMLSSMFQETELNNDTLKAALDTTCSSGKQSHDRLLIAIKDYTLEAEVAGDANS